MKAQLPSLPGSYVILMLNTQSRKLEIGSLGLQCFREGYYAYVGSALGPGGLRARVGRHLDITHDRPVHWHIDALTSVFDLIEIWLSTNGERLECLWADRLSINLSTPVQNLGSSDCRCISHLFFTQDRCRIMNVFRNLCDSFRPKFQKATIGDWSLSWSEDYGETNSNYIE